MLFSNFLPVIGLVCLAGVVVLQLWFENSGREIFFSEQVVKLNEVVKRGDIIESDMLYYAKVDKDSVIEGSIKDPNSIIGKAVKQYIPFNAQLNESYFEIPELITDADHLTMKIPNEWLYSIPNTLRGRDRIYLKEVTSDVIYAEDAARSKGPNTDPNALETEEKNEVVPTYTETDKNNIEAKASAVVLETIVAFVKDSSNREVVTLSQQDRMDGSSIIRDVEIVVTLEEAKNLEEIRKKGSKFIIMYTEG